MPRRRRVLDGLEDWLGERFRRHRGNADVVRQELLAEHGVARSACGRWSGRWRPCAASCWPRPGRRCGFETPPGRQLQIDCGERRVPIGGEMVRAHLFVATLGDSRRRHVRAFRHERQEGWFEGMEGAFHAFGGVPEEVLLDNARALVARHDPAAREVRCNDRLHAFAKHRGVRPRACAPYRARTKGKDERGVGDVKTNAIAGRSSASWAAFEAHLAWWGRGVADVRAHGTTGEPPLVRFERDEARVLRPLAGGPPFQQTRELTRRVQADCCIEVDGNAYSVPWRLIGASVRVEVTAGRPRACHAGREVAAHDERVGRRQRAIDPAHFEGVAGHRPGPTAGAAVAGGAPGRPPPQRLRPLAEYELIVGGGWG